MTKKAATGKSKTSKSAKPKTASKTRARLSGPKPPAAKTARAAVSVTETKAKPAPRKAAPTKVEAPTPVARPNSRIPAPTRTPPVELKKRELIELVVARSDVKKKFAKPVVEALLEVLGETVAKGREMNLPPMGKLKYNRTKESPAARVVVTKIRQSKAQMPAPGGKKLPVADAAE